MQKLKKLLNGKIQLKTKGNILVSFQKKASYTIVSNNRIDIKDTTNTKVSLFSNVLLYTEIEPAAAVQQNFSNSQELGKYLDINFFTG